MTDAERQRRYYVAHREAILEQKAAYYQAHKKPLRKVRKGRYLQMLVQLALGLRLERPCSACGKAKANLYHSYCSPCRREYDNARNRRIRGDRAARR